MQWVLGAIGIIVMIVGSFVMIGFTLFFLIGFTDAWFGDILERKFDSYRFSKKGDE